MNIQDLYVLFLKHPSVQTDTRSIKQGDLFFALKGANFNGNQFALDALAKGAAFAIVDEEIAGADSRVIKVEDVLQCLQDLAKYHRQQFNIPFIAITGSNGKTTTKELIYAVLASKYKTIATKGNLNNHIGIPLTLLSIPLDAEMAIIEMGANHQKEIASYCNYVLPTHGLITNCGKAHLEGFGGEEGVRKGKGELFDYIGANEGIIFVNWDYDYFHGMVHKVVDVVKYGTKEGTVVGSMVSSDPFLSVSVEKGFDESFVIDTHLVGAYNLPNVLSAVAVGHFFQVDSNDIKKSIEQYIPSNSRSQLLQKGSNSFILDAYNANPTSMLAAIENFANLQADSKMLILGAMMELGDFSVQEHRQIVDAIKQHQWQSVVLVGGDFAKVLMPEEGILYFDNVELAAEWLKHKTIAHTHILVKGSRSMKMEKVIPAER